MANLVRRHLESMTEEIEEMQRLLYKETEIKAIIRKREQFEHKINGISKHLQDYMRYIQFEEALIKQIKQRRNKDKVAEKKSSLEFKIIKRIRTLYEIAVERFNDNFPVHLSFFKFAKQFHFNGACAMVVQDMLKKFSHEPEVWQIAAAYHAYERKNINEALKIIYEGLRIHKDSKLLFESVINLELFKVKIKKRREDILEIRERALKSIEVYTKLIFKYIDDFTYFIQILELLSKYKFTAPVQAQIIETLLNNHKNEPLVWDHLAKRRLNGLQYELLDSEVESPLDDCIETYEKGLSSIPDEKRRELWLLYLNSLINLRQNKKFKDIVDLINDTLSMVLSRAVEEITLTEDYFKVWFELSNTESNLESTLKRAVETLPKSAEMWQLRLKYYVMKGDSANINDVFEEGKDALQEDSVQLWNSFIDYHCKTASFEKAKSVFESAIAENESVSSIFKSKYLQWIVKKKNLNEGRALYKKIAVETPFCKDLHKTMLNIEQTKSNVDLNFCEEIFQLASKQFGQNEIDIWLEYIKFYSTSIKKMQVPEIIKRAESSLNPNLKCLFQEELQTFFSNPC